MPNSEEFRFPYKIGDVIELKAPTLLQRKSQKTEDKLHVAAINYFDAIVSSAEYEGKRFALVGANHKGHWADRVVTAYPLSPSAVKRDWGTSPLPQVIRSTNQSACGLDGDYVVAPMPINVWTHWIEKKLCSVDAEFLNAYPNARRSE